MKKSLHASSYPISTAVCPRELPPCAQTRVCVCACGVCRPVRLYFSRQAGCAATCVRARTYGFRLYPRVRAAACILRLYFIAAWKVG